MQMHKQMHMCGIVQQVVLQQYQAYIPECQAPCIKQIWRLSSWHAAATAGVQRTDSFDGVVPVALTNTEVTADEATQGAPVTGPGIAEPFPSEAHGADVPVSQAKMDLDEHNVEVSTSDIPDLPRQALALQMYPHW